MREHQRTRRVEGERAGSAGWATGGRRRGFRVLLPLLAGLTWGAAAPAAPPDVPQGISYQGVLLDTQGAPRTGTVDLTLRVYDAVAGGTLVYTQSYANVPLSEGVFHVILGPTGQASDSPDDPLTDDLATALAGDAGPTGPQRFLEVPLQAFEWAELNAFG